MRKLYWKIFSWFWVTTAITIGVTAWISADFAQRTSNQYRDSAYIQTIASAAISILNTGDQAQYLAWAKFLYEENGVKLYLFPTKKIAPIYDSQRPDADLAQLFRTMPKDPEHKEMIRKPPFIISAPFTLKNGQSYRVAVKLPSLVANHLRFKWPTLLLRTIIAILISGFICYLLSYYLSKPIRILQDAAKKLGEGKLDTRVSHQLSSRKDEMSDLANEFDHMAERLQNSIHTRQRLLQDISHELRSPLARLYVALEMAKTNSHAEQKQELNRIEKEANRLNDLIGTILSLARLNVYENSIKLETTELSTLIQTIVDDANFELKNEEKQVIFLTKCACNLSLNKNLIRSAIENIVRNAIRYSDKQTSINVSLEKCKHHVIITVRDYGPGIPEEKIHHIFDPFYRVDDSRTTRSGGYGLGLAIAQKAILLHQGTISAHNAEDNGLIVTITLPLQKESSL